MFDTLISNIQVVSQAYGFTKTTMKVYNSTTPTDAFKAAVKGLIVDCSPPVV